MNTEFTSFAAMLTALPDDNACREYLELKRWGGMPACVHCGVVDTNHYRLNVKGEFKGMYKCRSCKHRFTVTLGTMFEGSPIGLRKWFIAAYMFSAHKKGVSSHQLGRDLEITQKSAWFLLHRIRETMKEIEIIPLGGEGVVVETDTTIVGGKVKNMSNKKRAAILKDKDKRNDNKTHVSAYIERSGKIRFDVVEEGENEPDLLRKHVDCTSVIMTDTANTYIKVGKEFAHHGSVDHSKSEYCRDSVYHTNTIEGAFSHFDRMVVGVYHFISKKHMQAYCNESAYRYNTRKAAQTNRFEDTVMKAAGVRLKYVALTSK